MIKVFRHGSSGIAQTVLKIRVPLVVSAAPPVGDSSRRWRAKRLAHESRNRLSEPPNADSIHVS